MKISWYIPYAPISTTHNYILESYQLYKEKYGDIRFDVNNGSDYKGNHIPSRKIKKIFDIFFSITKYRTTLNYIWGKLYPVDLIHLQYSFLYKDIIPLIKQKKKPKLVITLRGFDTYNNLYKTNIRFKELASNKFKKFV